MRINISQYPVFMKIGYYVGERLRGQEVLVTLVVHLLKAEGEIGESLEKTTDYAKILQVIDSTLRDKEMKLIETAVERLGEVLLRTFSQIQKIDLTIEKPILPDGIGRGARVSVSSEFLRVLAHEKANEALHHFG